MEKEQVVLVSRERFRPQLTGKRAIELAQSAFDANRDHDAKRLLSLAHDLFADELSADYVPGQIGGG